MGKVAGIGIIHMGYNMLAIIIGRKARQYEMDAGTIRQRSEKERPLMLCELCAAGNVGASVKTGREGRPVVVPGLCGRQAAGGSIVIA